MIVVQSPLRVSLFGGGTDFPSFYERRGGCVLTTAIDKYVFVTVKQRFDRKIRVGYTKTELTDRIDDIEHELIREALRTTGITEGVEITTMGDIPSEGSGLGSSSTVAVGALRALYAYRGEIVPPERLAREACDIEVGILDKPVGVQDQCIAAFGGLRFVNFMRDGQIRLESLSLETEVRQRLEENLMLFFTGITRSAGGVLAEQKANIPGRSAVLSEIRDLAIAARKELETGNVDAIGTLLHESWDLKKQLANGISNDHIDELYVTGRRAGALGGKITGAGGGGFLLFYCPREHQDQLRSALSGLKELPFQFERDGAKVIFDYRRRSAEVPASASDGHPRTSRSVAKLEWPTRQEGREPDVKYRDDGLSIDHYIDQLKVTLTNLPQRRIVECVGVLHEARRRGGQIFIMGNGGSASTASHFACDLGKNTRIEGWPDFRVSALTDNIATFSAYANDEGYENVFVRQLASAIKPDDVVIGISTSGDSPNVLKAIELANRIGAATIGFSGFDGGRLSSLVDLNIHVASESVEHVEDVHLALEHMICEALRQEASALRSMEASGIPSSHSLEGHAHQAEAHITYPSEILARPNEELTSAMTELLYQINREVASPKDESTLLRAILRRSVEGLGALCGSIILVDQDEKITAGATAFLGNVRSSPPKQFSGPVNHGLARWVLENREAVLVSKTQDDPRWLRRSWDKPHGQTRSAICVPLVTAGQVFGVLTLVRQGEEHFTAADLSRLAAIGTCISLIGLQPHGTRAWSGHAPVETQTI